MLIERIIELQLRGPGPPGRTCTPKTGYCHDKTKISKENPRVDYYLLLKCCKRQCTLPVADPENFGGGDLKHKTSKIRMSSPKLRVIFRPKSEIQPFFLLKFRWSPKKKKKVFTKIETDFSPDSLRLGRWGGCIPKWTRIIRNRG